MSEINNEKINNEKINNEKINNEKINEICDTLNEVIKDLKFVDDELKQAIENKLGMHVQFSKDNNNTKNIPAGSVKPQINMANNRWMNSLRD